MMKIGEVYLIGNCPHEIVEITGDEVVLVDAVGSPVLMPIEVIQNLERVVD